MAAQNFTIRSIEDYNNLMRQYNENEDASDDERQDFYKNISNAVQDAVWRWLFEAPQATPENEQLAADLLKVHRPEACFYAPWDYNDWIVLVRDELLRRNMIRFWRDEVVKEELGPIWARDSDYFDDMYDQEPANFYEHAGCVAPFPKPEPQADDYEFFGAIPQNPTAEDFPPLPVPAAVSTPPTEPAVQEIIQPTSASPAADYKSSIDKQLEEDENNKEALARIFISAQQAIWELLFKEPKLGKSNFTKAAYLLKAYKEDACFFAPMPYNQWIYKVRDELFQRKELDFWQKVIVEQKCGLCSYEDSDYFDDKRDKSHIEFYKSGEALVNAAAATAEETPAQT